MREDVVIVFGATGGIGNAIANLAWNDGYTVIAVGHTRTMNLPEGLERYYSVQLRQGLGHPGIHAGDYRVLLSMIDGQRLAGMVVAHGAPPCIKPAVEVSRGDWEEIMHTDAYGAFEVCQAFYEPLKAAQGAIVLVSSVHALGSYPQRVPYAMAKSAICGLGRALACEWGPDGIRVNVVAPGQVSGERTAQIARTQPEILDKMVGRMPLGVLVDPVAVAQTAVFLLAPSHMTGQTLAVDGGLTASLWYDSYIQPG